MIDYDKNQDENEKYITYDINKSRSRQGHKYTN